MFKAPMFSHEPMVIDKYFLQKYIITIIYRVTHAMWKDIYNQQDRLSSTKRPKKKDSRNASKG